MNHQKIKNYSRGKFDRKCFCLLLRHNSDVWWDFTAIGEKLFDSVSYGTNLPDRTGELV